LFFNFHFFLRINIEYEGQIIDYSTQKVKRLVKFGNELKTFEVLNILDFDSTRKRMSIIVRDLSTNIITVYCKGAESAMFPSCSIGDIETTNKSLDNFSEKGWRTLVTAHRQITEEEYLKIEGLIADAQNDIMFQDEKMAKVLGLIETNLTLIGATGIEDKLQEDVAETLTVLREAGIKIWVLTGDKKQTAINISHSCEHFNENMKMLTLTATKNPTRICKILAGFEEK
jgi:phospholipid-translocating ATPase